MDIKTEFQELKKLKKSPEVADTLNKLLSHAKNAKDSSLCLEIILYQVECQRVLRKHDEAIKILETEMNDDFFGEKEKRLVIIDELVKTLLKTEDFHKLESTLMSRERFLTNDHQKVMQKFYYAVCYEGLKEYKKAIDSLKNIKDIISASNLVSKYLKLSMLYLKVGNLGLAKDNFEHAKKFDHLMKNPIFCLAESDILFHESDYQNALTKYQEYFIKSKNKRRYLDRFILISIELDRLDDAWRFYQEYLPTMTSIVSKNYRLVFYEAGLKLAKILNNTAEIEKLEFLIDELAPKAPVMNRFDSVYRLLSIVFQNTRFRKQRDIVHHLFQAIDSLYNFQKMIYVIPEEQNVIVYHYTKGLLLEKSMNILTLTETPLDTIIGTRPVNDLYNYDDLIEYPRGIYKTVETKYIFANGIEQANEFAYFIVYSKDTDQFDFQQKLVLLASEILKKQINDFNLSQEVTEQVEHFGRLMDLTEGGLIKIEKNIIHFLNNRAKEMFEVDTDYLAFEEFQKFLVDKVFIDDFLYTDNLILKLKSKEGIKSFSLDISKSEFTIYALIKEAKVTGESQFLNPFLEIADERQLLKDNQSTDSKSIILFDIRNYLEYFKDYNHENYRNKLESICIYLKDSARSHYDGIYLESFNLLYLTVKTTDKRVTGRISESLVKSFPEFDIRVSIIQINHRLRYDKLIQLRYLDSLTTIERSTLYDNKNFRYNQELSKTLLINVRQLLQKKSLPLMFETVQDISNNSVAFLKVGISEKAMLGEMNGLKRVIKANDLENEWDNLVASMLQKSSKHDNLQHRFLLDVFASTLLDNKQLQKVARKAGELDLTLMVDMSENLDLDGLKTAKEYLKTRNIKLVGYDFMGRLNLLDMKLFECFDNLILKISDLSDKTKMEFLKMLQKSKIEYILDHQNETLKRSDLDALGIRLVYGAMSSKYENATAQKNG